jgi:Txe/YoeB family toxin of Txe-Axe toxin-antitoxin module
MAAALPKDQKSTLFRILWLLSQDFRHPSLQCKKVKSAGSNVYECRVDQGTRLIYDVVNQSVRCWFVGEHDAALSFAAALTTGKRQVFVDDISVTSTPSPGAESWRKLSLDELRISLDCE